MIDPRIAFVCSEHEERTPFGRTYEVLSSLSWSMRSIASEMRRLDAGDIQIRRRGLAGDVEEIRRALKPSGSRRLTLMMTRHRDRPWALLCVDPAAQVSS